MSDSLSRLRFSSVAVSVTLNPGQYFITNTFLEVKPGTSSGIITFRPVQIQHIASKQSRSEHKRSCTSLVFYVVTRRTAEKLHKKFTTTNFASMHYHKGCE
jgi:hypothetical protein